MTQFNSTEEIYEAADRLNVEFVRLQFPDTNGLFRETEIGTDLLETAFRKGLPFDCAAGDGSWMTGADTILKPDPRTFSILPWKENKGVSARVICDVCLPDGSPYEGCARYALKKMVRRMYQSDCTMQVAPAVSFFLFDIKDDVITAASPDGGSLYGSEPAGKAEDVRRDIFRALKKLDVDVDSSHQGAAPGQYEFVLRKAGALRAADNIMTVKYAARTIARLHGLHAAFMPKPVSGMPGSGMPLRISVFKNEDNLFFRSDGDMMLSPEARSFIGGLFNHVRAMSLVTNPVVNSYKRLMPGSEAPVRVSWSVTDRKALVRIPPPRGKNTQVELRSPDASCNPYLALSLIPACGLEGIEKGADPGKTSDAGAPPDEESGHGGLPRSLSESLAAFRADPLMEETLGPAISAGLIRKAARDWEEYSACVHQWEIDKYIHTL